MTVGTAISFLFQSFTTDAVVFVESDFVVDVPPESVRAQMLASAQLHSRGLPIVRLQSRRTIGQPGGLDAPCCSAASDTPHRQCVYRVHGSTWQRQANWRNFYCDADMPMKGVQLATCVTAPRMR